MRTLAQSVAPRQSGIFDVGSLVCMWNAMPVRPVLACVLHLTALRPTAGLNIQWPGRVWGTVGDREKRLEVWNGDLVGG